MIKPDHSHPIHRINDAPGKYFVFNEKTKVLHRSKGFLENASCGADVYSSIALHCHNKAKAIHVYRKTEGIQLCGRCFAPLEKWDDVGIGIRLSLFKGGSPIFDTLPPALVLTEEGWVVEEWKRVHQSHFVYLSLGILWEGVDKYRRVFGKDPGGVLLCRNRDRESDTFSISIHAAEDGNS